MYRFDIDNAVVTHAKHRKQFESINCVNHSFVSESFREIVEWKTVRNSTAHLIQEELGKSTKKYLTRLVRDCVIRSVENPQKRGNLNLKKHLY